MASLALIHFGAGTAQADTGTCKPVTLSKPQVICDGVPGANGFDPEVFCSHSDPNSPTAWKYDAVKHNGMCSAAITKETCESKFLPYPQQADFACKYEYPDTQDGILEVSATATEGQTTEAVYSKSSLKVAGTQVTCQTCTKNVTLKLEEAGGDKPGYGYLKLNWQVPNYATQCWPSGIKQIVQVTNPNSNGGKVYTFVFNFSIQKGSNPSTEKVDCSTETVNVAGPGTPPAANSITSDYLKGQYPRPDGYTGPIPDCAFSGTCRSTSDLVILLINAAKFLFSIIGVVAFAAFIYGGFMMIFSFGNSEKVSQGKDAMVAAVVGLIIAFGAYMIINFVLNALGVTPEFRGIIDSK